MSVEHNFTFIFKDANGDLQIMYPRTVAQQVLLQSGQTMADHVNDNDYHLLSTEESMMKNANRAGGLLQLDTKGWIPLTEIDGSLIAIKTEFRTIQDMLTNGGNVHQASLVMVFDASGDTRNTEGWAIYRRKTSSTDFTDLDLGWQLVNSQASRDISSAWKDSPGIPRATSDEIDSMVSMLHNHTNTVVLDYVTVSDDGKYICYHGKPIAYDSEVYRFYEGDYLDDDAVPGKSFWLKPSYAQTWWGNISIEDAGTSCYEKYRENDTMVTAPKLRTHNVTTMCRMFYQCYDLTEVPQYDTIHVIDFTGMFSECSELKTVPIMGTINGTTFDNMFYKCSNLLYSPEMSLASAQSCIGMYSGCANMTRVLPFGSTAKVTSMKQMFNGCTSLTRISTPIDFTSITTDDAVLNMFNECNDLEEVSFVDGTLKVSLSLADTNLSLESILGIIQGLPRVTGKTLTLTGIPSVGELTADNIQVATDKGWSVVTASA